MEIQCFGISKDITKSKSIEVSCEGITNVSDLKEYLVETYPEFTMFDSFMVAVNHSYAENDQVITSTDEIAIIPPVSGG